MYYANVEHIQASVVREYVRHFHYSPPLPEDFDPQVVDQERLKRFLILRGIFDVLPFDVALPMVEAYIRKEIAGRVAGRLRGTHGS